MSFDNERNEFDQCSTKERIKLDYALNPPSPLPHHAHARMSQCLCITFAIPSPHQNFLTDDFHIFEDLPVEMANSEAKGSLLQATRVGEPARIFQI